MKEIILVLLFFLGAVYSQDLFMPGRPLPNRRVSSRALETSVSAICNGADKANKNYCNDKTFCEATGFYMCDSTGSKGILIPCKGSSGTYCNEPTAGAAKCQKTPVTGCETTTPESTFTCTGTGIFPDPADCKKYYNCYLDSTKGLQSQVFGCENLYVFDPSAPNGFYCRLTNNNYCTKASCTGLYTNVLMAFTWFPKSKGQYVTSCLGEQTLVYRCEAGFEADLDTLPVECNYICRKDERAIFAADNTKYYQCIYNGQKYVPKLTDCFFGTYFNPKTKICEASPTVAPTTVPPTEPPTCGPAPLEPCQQG